MTRLLRRLKFALRVLFATDPEISTGRQLTNWGGRLGLTYEQSRPFVHLWKNLKQPIRAMRHKRLVSRIDSTGITPEQARTLADGYAAFSVDDVPNGRKVADLLIRLWRDRCLGDTVDEEMIWRQKGDDYPSLRNCLKADDLLHYPEIADFVLSDLFLALAARNLNAVPRLASVMLWWTTANDLTDSSQLYHADMEDGRQLKIFINLTDVNDAQGPFTFLPASVSRTVRKALGHTHGRLEDEAVYRHCSPNQAATHIGCDGSGMAVDTSRCLHYGSRTRTGERLIFMIQFAPFNVQLESVPPAPPIDAHRYAGESVRRLIVETAKGP